MFVASRVARLWPAYLACATISTLLISTCRPSWRSGVSLREYLVNLTMVPNLINVDYIEPVYWTLWSELRFYIMVAILTTIGISRGRLIGLAWAWLVTAAALQSASAANLGGLGTLEIILQPDYAAYFCLGIAMYALASGGRSPGLLLLASLSAGASLFSAGMNAANKEDGSYDPLVAASVIAILLCALVVVLRARRAGVLQVAFSRLGALTYPLYLIHSTLGYMIINYLLKDIGFAWSVMAALCTSLLLAHLVNQFVERPLAPIVRRGILGSRVARP